MVVDNFQETELYTSVVEGQFYAVWGGYAEPSALSVSLLNESVVIKVTVLLPEQLN